MEFLRAYEVAQSLGISFDDFRSIWERETDVGLLELQRAQKVQAVNPNPNLSTSYQSRDHGESSLSGLLLKINANMENIAAQLGDLNFNIQTSQEMQANANERIVEELCDLRERICEQSREDEDQILYNGQERITWRAKYGHVVVQPADNFKSHGATDIGSILATPFSAIRNSTPDVILTPLEISSCPTDGPAVRQQAFGSVYRDELQVDNIHNTTVDVPTAQELPGVVKTRAPPVYATMGRSSRHSSLFPPLSVNLTLKEKFSDGLNVLAEENSLSGLKGRSKKDVKVEEDYIENGVKVGESVRGKLEVKAEARAHGKNEVKAEETVKPGAQDDTQVKELFKTEERDIVTSGAQDETQVKELFKAEERDIVTSGAQDETQVKELFKVEERDIVTPGAQDKAGSKGTLFNAEKRTNPHMLDVVEGRHVVEGAEKHTMMQSPSDSSDGHDDLDQKTSEYKYIDYSGRTSIGALSPQCSFESDYFYTQGPKTCQVKLVFNAADFLSVKLRVSHAPGAREDIWPIFFDGSGKVFNMETDKPSPLWTLKEKCDQPGRGEEKEIEANISLVTKDGSFQEVTFELLENRGFVRGNCFKFFWEVTTS